MSGSSFEENNLFAGLIKLKILVFTATSNRDDFLFEVDRDRAKQFVKEHYPKLYTPEILEFKKLRKG